MADNNMQRWINTHRKGGECKKIVSTLYMMNMISSSPGGWHQPKMLFFPYSFDKLIAAPSSPMWITRTIWPYYNKYWGQLSTPKFSCVTLRIHAIGKGVRRQTHDELKLPKKSSQQDHNVFNIPENTKGCQLVVKPAHDLSKCRCFSRRGTWSAWL